MSFQAYLDNVETKTGITPRRFIALAAEQGFELGSKPGQMITWLKAEYGIGYGHAMAIAHVITKGPEIASKHVATDGAHSDPSEILWLEGKDSKPDGY